MKVLAIHYVDFSGDLQRAICDDLVDLAGGELPRNVTVFMSSATCPGCQSAIQRKIAAVGQPPSCAAKAASNFARTSSTLMPAPRAHAMP